MPVFTDGAFDLEVPPSPLFVLGSYVFSTSVYWPTGSDGSTITYDGVDSAFTDRGPSQLTAAWVHVKVYDWEVPPTVTVRLYTPTETASASGSAVATRDYVPWESRGAATIPLTLPADQDVANLLYDASRRVYWDGDEDAIRLDVSISGIVASTRYPDPTNGVITDDVAVAFRLTPAFVGEPRSQGAVFK